MPVRRAHLPCHRRFMETKVQFGFVAIVGAAAELDVVDRRFATRTRQSHPRMTPRGPADRSRKHVKSLVLAMKTFSSTQLGPDRVARNALIRRCGTTGGTLIREIFEPPCSRIRCQSKWSRN